MQDLEDEANVVCFPAGREKLGENGYSRRSDWINTWSSLRTI